LKNYLFKILVEIEFLFDNKILKLGLKLGEHPDIIGKVIGLQILNWEKFKRFFE
jgi:hypothetical protein